MGRKKYDVLYWKADGGFKGKLVDHPDIVAWGENLKELEDNLYDTFEAMLFVGVDGEYDVMEIEF